jgi:hypothetical protein
LEARIRRPSQGHYEGNVTMEWEFHYRREFQLTPVTGVTRCEPDRR